MYVPFLASATILRIHRIQSPLRREFRGLSGATGGRRLLDWGHSSCRLLGGRDT